MGSPAILMALWVKWVLYIRDGLLICSHRALQSFMAGYDRATVPHSDAAFFTLCPRIEPFVYIGIK